MSTPDRVYSQLDELGHEEVINRLHDIYSLSLEMKTRLRILEILNQLHDNTHFDQFENYFISDEDLEVRLEAAKILIFHYPKKEALKPFLWVLSEEKDSEVKYTIFRLLVALLESQVIPNKESQEIICSIIDSALKSRDYKMRMLAVESIGILKDIRYKDLLKDMIKDADNRLIIIKIIQAFGQLRDFDSIPFLIEYLGKESLDLWQFSFNSLKKIADRELLTDVLMEAIKEIERLPYHEKNSYFKQGIVKALGELRRKEAIELLLTLLDDEYYWVRDEAADALDKIESGWRIKYKDLIKGAYRYSIPSCGEE